MNEFLKDLIKGTNIEIYEPSVDEFIKAYQEAESFDFIGEPFYILHPEKKQLWLFIHDMPSCDDSPYECWHLYKKFELKTLKEVLL